MAQSDDDYGTLKPTEAADDRYGTLAPPRKTPPPPPKRPAPRPAPAVEPTLQPQAEPAPAAPPAAKPDPRPPARPPAEAIRLTAKLARTPSAGCFRSARKRAGCSTKNRRCSYTSTD